MKHLTSLGLNLQDVEYGWESCDGNDAAIDGYRNGSKMTHAARESGIGWESKLGRRWRIRHKRRGLTDPRPEALYGQIVIRFRRPPSTTGSVTERSTAAISAPSQSGTKSSTSPTSAPTYTFMPQTGPIISSSEDVIKVSALSTSLSTTFETLSQTFEALYAAWKATWFATEAISMEQRFAQPKILIFKTKFLTYLWCSSAERAKGPQWDSLIKLGPNVLPFVVAKLATTVNQFACGLCK
jgi:hypothetical protein